MIKTILIFVLLFTIDNLLGIIFPLRSLFSGSYTAIPYLTLIGFCIHAFYDEDNRLPWIAFAFGLIYDMYAANLLGLYATMFPLIVIIIKKYIVTITPINFISLFYIVTVTILAVETIIYLFVVIITPRTTSPWAFIQYRLVVTIVFNTILLAIIYPLLNRILKPKTRKKKVKNIMKGNTHA